MAAGSARAATTQIATTRRTHKEFPFLITPPDSSASAVRADAARGASLRHAERGDTPPSASNSEKVTRVALMESRAIDESAFCLR